MTDTAVIRPFRLKRMLDSDLYYSFRRHPAAVIAALLLAFLTLTAAFAPLIAPQNPYDMAALDLWNAELPPIWQEGGQWPFLLGTDVQGRDVLSAILYGSRVSILIGVASVAVSLAAGSHPPACRCWPEAVDWSSRSGARSTTATIHAQSASETMFTQAAQPPPMSVVPPSARPQVPPLRSVPSPSPARCRDGSSPPRR